MLPGDDHNVRKPSIFRTTRFTALLLIAGLVVPARAAAAGVDFDAGAGDLPAPTVRAKAAIIYNPTTRTVLWEDHAQDQLSIAQPHEDDDGHRLHGATSGSDPGGRGRE